MSERKKTLKNDDIKTAAQPERRRVLGLLGLGAAATGAMAMSGQQAYAQGADIDNGQWTDSGSCPRGIGGAYTGLTDADNGSITDAGGYGRGAPYC